MVFGSTAENLRLGGVGPLALLGWVWVCGWRNSPRPGDAGLDSAATVGLGNNVIDATELKKRYLVVFCMSCFCSRCEKVVLGSTSKSIVEYPI